MKLEVIAEPELLAAYGVPAFATPGSAAVDLRVPLNLASNRAEIVGNENCAFTVSLIHENEEEDVITSIDVFPGGQVVLDTGLKIHIKDPNFVGLVVPRSSMGKKGLSLANSVGIIDSDYQGSLKLVIRNHLTDRALEIADGDRVAQYLVTPVVKFDLELVEEFSAASERGEGGFGSTGVN